MCGEDLPTPPYGHPCLEKVLHLGKPLFPHFSLQGGDFQISLRLD